MKTVFAVVVVVIGLFVALFGETSRLQWFGGSLIGAGVLLVIAFSRALTPARRPAVQQRKAPRPIVEDDDPDVSMSGLSIVGGQTTSGYDLDRPSKPIFPEDEEGTGRPEKLPPAAPPRPGETGGMSNLDQPLPPPPSRPQGSDE